MGKGLGDYIHFHANNYMEYGINRVSEGASSDWEENLIAIIKEKIDTTQKLFNLNPYSKFQDVLKWLMDPPTGAAAYEGTNLSYKYLLHEIIK